MTLKTISEQTPVTAAAAAAVVVVAFWGGLKIGELTTDVDALKAASAQLTSILTTHEGRLAALEK